MREVYLDNAATTKLSKEAYDVIKKKANEMEAPLYKVNLNEQNKAKNNHKRIIFTNTYSKTIKQSYSKEPAKQFLL